MVDMFFGLTMEALKETGLSNCHFELKVAV